MSIIVRHSNPLVGIASFLVRHFRFDFWIMAVRVEQDYHTHVRISYGQPR